MQEIKPVDRPYSIQIKDQRLFVAPAAAAGAGAGAAVVVAVKWIWDVILSKVIASAVESFGQEVGKRAAEALFGGANSAANRQINAKLDVVIGKLDEVLFAIRALGPLFREISLQTLRERLRAEMLTLIEANLLVIERVANADSESKKEEAMTDLKRLSEQLDFLTGSILNYQEEGTGRPLGLPMYAAVQAGLVTMFIAFRVRGEDCTAQFERAKTRFREWHNFLEKQTAPLRENVEREVAFLNGLPHATAMGIGNYEDAGGIRFFMHTVSTNQNCFFVDAVIEGSAEVPFRLVEIRRGADFVWWDDAKFAEVVKNGPQWPYPYNFNNQPPTTIADNPVYWIGLYAQKFVAEVNERRNAMLQTAEALQDLQDIMDSLLLAPDQLKLLLP